MYHKVVHHLAKNEDNSFHFALDLLDNFLNVFVLYYFLWDCLFALFEDLVWENYVQIFKNNNNKICPCGLLFEMFLTTLKA